EGLIQKVIRTEDLQTDGAKLASALLSGAKALEDRADMAEEEEDAMIIVDFQPLPQDGFSYTLHGFPESWMAGHGGRRFRSWLGGGGSGACSGVAARCPQRGRGPGSGGWSLRPAA